MARNMARDESIEFIEPGQCSWCFTLRGVAISTIVGLVFTAILVFVLDLTIILKLNYWQRSRSFLVQDDGTLEIDPGQGYGRYLNHIDLSNLEVNVSTLQRSMVTGMGLEVIRLKNLKFNGKLRRGFGETGVFQPNLTEFSLELNQTIGPSEEFQLDDCDECIVESSGIYGSLDLIRNIRCLPSMLFYINMQITPLGLELMPIMTQVNINISVLGRNLLTFQPENKTLVTMFRECEAPIDLIRSANSSVQIRKLAFSSCINLSATTLRYWLTSWNVTSLVLDDVEVTGLGWGDRISELFQNATSLEELVIKGGLFREINSTSEHRRYDGTRVIKLHDLPTSLKTLVLSSVVMLPSDRPSQLNLESLILNQVIFHDSETFTSFPTKLKYKNIAVRHPSTWPWSSRSRGRDDYSLKEEDSYSRLFSFFYKMMERARRIWFEHPFHRIHEDEESFVSRHPGEDALYEVPERHAAELDAWRRLFKRKGIDETILMKYYPAFTFVRNEKVFKGRHSWRFEFDNTTSFRKDNAEVWFRFLKMGTFLREDLWDKLEW